MTWKNSKNFAPGTSTKGANRRSERWLVWKKDLPGKRGKFPKGVAVNDEREGIDRTGDAKFMGWFDSEQADWHVTEGLILANPGEHV